MKRKHVVTTILRITFFAMPIGSFAQNNVVYKYDANGNRTERIYQVKTPPNNNKMLNGAKIEKNKVHIEIPLYVKLSDCVIMLSDISGNVLEMRQSTSYIEIIDIENLKSGVYIVSIIINNNIESRKFIK